MKSLSGRASDIMILLIILIVSILILVQTGIVKAQNESNITGYGIANITSNITENFTLENETFSYNLTENVSEVFNETLIPNETSQENFTLNETLEENETIEILNETNETSIEPSVEEPIFDIKLNYPEKITRGETLNIRAETKITNSLTAKNVVLKWILPNSFDIISGNGEEFCGDLDTNDPCYSEISVKTDLSIALGLNEIKIVINYEK